MKTNDIKILFFDIGGVLLTNGWGYASRQKAAQQFCLDLTELEALHQFVFNVYEISSITLDEYLDRVVFNHPRTFTKDDFITFMFAQSSELPGMLQWLKEWKRSARFLIYSINNEGRELNNYRIEKFRLHQCFDAFISSCEVGMRKPDPRIFTLAMGIAQASPHQCMYIDDRPILIQAAQNLGIQSFLHRSFTDTKRILNRL